jgi:hypothetical protein
LATEAASGMQTGQIRLMSRRTPMAVPGTGSTTGGRLRA